MKFDWTPTGGALVNLGDDANGKRVHIETPFGLSALEQVDELAFADKVFRALRGNQRGDCIFTSRKSHATMDAAAQYFAGEEARIDQQGTLVATFTAQTLTMTNATLRSVLAVDINGVDWTLKYTFGITSITNP